MDRRGFPLATVIVALSATAAAATDWDMALAYPASNYHSETAAEFAACVADRSSGSLRITTHPDGSWIAGDDITQAVESGRAPIGERLISAMVAQNPLYGIDSIPFLATSFAASDRLWQAAEGSIETALGADNLVYVYAVPWPPQGLYVDKPIASVADLGGMTFRTYNAATTRLAELAKMRPIPIEAANLVPALASGAVQGFISSAATGFDDAVWRYMDRFYNLQGWLPRNVVFINKDAWNRLDSTTQQAIMTCGAAAAKNGEARAKAAAQSDLDALAENGMTVSPPSDRLRADLDRIGEIIAEEWLTHAGSEGRAVLEAYRAQ